MDEKELVILLRNQDRKAFSYLYDNYSATLLGIITKVIGQGVMASDLLQEVFIKIWKNIAHYDDSKGTLYTWMFNIARNSAIDILRSSEFKKSMVTATLSANTSQHDHHRTHFKIEHIGVKTIVSKLKKEFSSIIELTYFRGFTHEEVAKSLNIPLGTVKTRTRYALLEMRQTMQ